MTCFDKEVVGGARVCHVVHCSSYQRCEDLQVREDLVQCRGVEAAMDRVQHVGAVQIVVEFHLGVLFVSYVDGAKKVHCRANVQL